MTITARSETKGAGITIRATTDYKLIRSGSNTNNRQGEYIFHVGFSG